MSKMKRLTLQKSWCCAAALLAVLCLSAQAPVLAQDQPPPAQGTSRGENFSAKPPAALFASDCTGAGCHKGPQGLNKGQGFGGLAGFLREHYTNSRESAAALAGYLSKLPSAPEPKEARTPPSRPGKPAAVAPTSSSPGWAEGFGFPPSREQASPPKPAPNEARVPRDGQKPAGKPTRAAARPDTAAKPDEDPATAPTMTPSAAPAAHQPADAEPTESDAKPEAPAKPPLRAQRGRHPTAAAAAPPAAAPPAPPPAPAAEVAPAAPPAPPQPKYDIFD